MLVKAAQPQPLRAEDVAYGHDASISGNGRSFYLGSVAVTGGHRISVGRSGPATVSELRTLPAGYRRIIISKPERAEVAARVEIALARLMPVVPPRSKPESLPRASSQDQNHYATALLAAGLSRDSIDRLVNRRPANRRAFAESAASFTETLDVKRGRLAFSLRALARDHVAHGRFDKAAECFERVLECSAKGSGSAQLDQTQSATDRLELSLMRHLASPAGEHGIPVRAQLLNDIAAEIRQLAALAPRKQDVVAMDLLFIISRYASFSPQLLPALQALAAYSSHVLLVSEDVSNADTVESVRVLAGIREYQGEFGQAGALLETLGNKKFTERDPLLKLDLFRAASEMYTQGDLRAFGQARKLVLQTEELAWDIFGTKAPTVAATFTIETAGVLVSANELTKAGQALRSVEENFEPPRDSSGCLDRAALDKSDLDSRHVSRFLSLKAALALRTGDFSSAVALSSEALRLLEWEPLVKRNSSDFLNAELDSAECCLIAGVEGGSPDAIAEKVLEFVQDSFDPNPLMAVLHRAYLLAARQHRRDGDREGAEVLLMKAEKVNHNCPWLNRSMARGELMIERTILEVEKAFYDSGVILDEEVRQPVGYLNDAVRYLKDFGDRAALLRLAGHVAISSPPCGQSPALAPAAEDLAKNLSKSWGGDPLPYLKARHFIREP